MAAHVAPAPANALIRNVRRSIFTTRCKVEDGRAGHGDPSGNAVVTSPRTVIVLQLQNLLRHLRMPIAPFLAARALQTVVDVEIGKELLSANRTETFDEPRVGKLGADGGDLRFVLRPGFRRAAELLKGLRIFIQVYSGRRRGAWGHRQQTPIAYLGN